MTYPLLSRNFAMNSFPPLSLHQADAFSAEKTNRKSTTVAQSLNEFATAMLIHPCVGDITKSVDGGPSVFLHPNRGKIAYSTWLVRQSIWDVARPHQIKCSQSRPTQSLPNDNKHGWQLVLDEARMVQHSKSHPL